MAQATPHPRGRKGRFIAIALIVAWLAALISVYVVIVQLKRGGVEGIQSQHRSGPAAEQAPHTP